MIKKKKKLVEISLDDVASDYLPDFEHVVSNVHSRYLRGRASAEEVRRDLETLRCRFPKPRPHPSTFDLDRELRWTFPMALAWIVWRTPEKVSEYSPSYRRVARTWGEITLYQHSSVDYSMTHSEPAIGLIKLSTHVLSDLQKEAAADGEFCDSRDQAQLELWRALISSGDDNLPADGIPEFEGRRVAIPNQEFADLTLVQDGAHDASLRSVREGAGYAAPRLNPDAVRRRWRVASPRKKSLSSAREHFRIWLTETIRSSPDVPTMTNKQIRQAIEHLPGMAELSKPSFEQVRREVIAELGAAAWGSGGRRKSSRLKPPNQ